jgi:phage terminase Nu1 subunit (DNA packaging protein)
MPIVDVTKVASALNLDPRRVQQLVKEGMPRVSRGQYDPVKCMVWYIRYLQNAIERRSAPNLDGAHVGESRERVRLLRAAADLKEMRLSQQRSQLVAVRDVEAMTKDLVCTTSAVIMAIAPRLAPELVGDFARHDSGEIRTRLQGSSLIPREIGKPWQKNGHVLERMTP